MNLHIAGFNHFDPAGRTRLRGWLDRLSAEHSEPPAFVAVEWDQQNFADVKAERALFRKLMQRQWPEAAPDLLDELELSLGYGGDTHTVLFPDVPVVWLDQGRRCDLSDYARKRLNMYKLSLAPHGSPHNASAALSRLSQSAWENAKPPSAGDERDRKFASLLLQHIDQVAGDWAIAIVGSNHATTNPGYLRRLLEDGGQPCEVTILRP
jgi:hypothetical protein